MSYLLAALGRARCRVAIDQVFAGKIAITSLDLFCDANLASAFVARG